MKTHNYKVMIVAGEASGDLHAAKLVNALRESGAGATFEFFGAAGERMRAAGVESIVQSDGLSIVGLPEIGRALPMFWKAFSDLKRSAAARRPDVVILVDFPDFNLKLARSLSRQGMKIVYYISPQLWAWRQYRIRSVIKYVDLLISILPFEKDWYAAHGVTHVEYVGSPLAREVHATMDKEGFCSEHGLDPTKPIVSLLPGSRHKEIVRIMPVMLESAIKVNERDSSVQFVIAAGSRKNLDDIVRCVERFRSKGTRLPDKLVTVIGETFNALNASDAAAITSGTATLEAGIIGTPMAIVYKTSALNYKLLRPLIEVDHFGLVNLIAGERVATELIQDEFDAVALSDELFRLLDPRENRNVRQKLEAARDKLGKGGASRRAAEHILRMVRDQAGADRD